MAKAIDTAINEEGAFTGSLMDDFATAASNESPNDEAVNMDFNDVYDEIVHPTGTECKLRIVNADKGVNKKGADYWLLRCEDTNDAHVKMLSVFVGFPGPNDDIRTKNNKKKAFMKFKEAFDIPLEQPVTLNMLIGLEAWAILRQSETEQYGAQNEVKQWILHR